MGWELIGGDPAPGSPDTVGTSSTALRRVGDIAGQARSDLAAKAGAAGVQTWTGAAADAFRDDMGKLPSQLGLINTSYEEAATALDRFRSVLTDAQAEARAALALATQAAADRDAAVQRHRSAESEVEALTVQKAKAQASLVALQTQQKLSLDPAHRSSLNAPITSSTSQVNRLSGDLTSAKQAAARYQSQIDDANARLKQAQQRADTIRQRLDQAANTAADALKIAERDAQLPSWAAEHLQRSMQYVTRNAANIKNVLQVVQMICTVASMVFPVAAPVLMTVSLVCAGLVLATDLVKDADTPGGFSTGNLWELGGDALGVIASAAGLGAMTKAISASKGFEAVGTSIKASQDLNAARGLATASKFANTGQQIAQVGQGYAEHGATGALVAVGTMALGNAVADKGSTKLLDALADVKSSPAIRSELSDMSLELKTDDPTPNLVGTPIDGLPYTPGIRGVLASGHQGQVGQVLGAQYASELVDPVKDYAVDQLLPRLEDAIAGPDIDIDLNPSPYGRAP